MKSITRALVGSLAAAAMAASAVTPALARDGHGDSGFGGGIGAGEIIAGAVVLGGIAAVAASAGSRERDYGYGRAGYDNWRGDRGRDWGHGNGHGFGRDNSRGAVERCVHAAEQAASRHSYGRADVTDVRDIRETRYGFEVRGRIAVNSMGRNWRHGDGRYGRGWNNDYSGWNDSMRGYDSGSFKCKVERGRIVDLDFSGIRGL